MTDPKRPTIDELEDIWLRAQCGEVKYNNCNELRYALRAALDLLAEAQCSGHVWTALDGHPAQCSVCGAQRRASHASAVDVESLCGHIDDALEPRLGFKSRGEITHAIRTYFARLAASVERKP